MPDWAAGKPSKFWAAAERFGRINGRSYREINVALQNELSLSDNMDLVKEFIRNSGIEDDHAYYYSIHARMTADNKQQNIHAHIMFNEKII
ncbi:MAG: MobA/MobL family protein [Acidaminococcaceae bacterium]|nr:MobA/MobL family protein [Acidaminococcaceae bacterium]